MKLKRGISETIITRRWKYVATVQTTKINKVEWKEEKNFAKAKNNHRIFRFIKRSFQFMCVVEFWIHSVECVYDTHHNHIKWHTNKQTYMCGCVSTFIAQRCSLSTNHFRFNQSNKIKYRRNKQKFPCHFITALVTEKKKIAPFALSFHPNTKTHNVIVITFSMCSFHNTEAKVIIMV